MTARREHRIKAARVTPIALKDPPLLNASGVHEPYSLRAIIEVELESGIVGLGETYGDMPGPGQLQHTASQLQGSSVYDLRALGLRVSKNISTLKGVADDHAHDSVFELATGTANGDAIAKTYAAFECAFYDAQARIAGLPLADYLGQRVRDKVPYAAYLFFKYAHHINPPYSPDAWGEALDAKAIVAQAKAMIEQYGFGSIKLKAGTQDANF